MAGSVWPNKNEEVAHKSPVPANARAHPRIAHRLEITAFIAQSLAPRYQRAVFPLVVSDSTNLASVEGQRMDDHSLELIRKKRKEASQVFSPPCYSPFGESD